MHRETGNHPGAICADVAQLCQRNRATRVCVLMRHRSRMSSRKNPLHDCSFRYVACSAFRRNVSPGGIIFFLFRAVWLYCPQLKQTKGLNCVQAYRYSPSMAVLGLSSSTICPAYAAAPSRASGSTSASASRNWTSRQVTLSTAPCRLASLMRAWQAPLRLPPARISEAIDLASV